MIAATSNSTWQNFRSTMPFLWTFAGTSPGIPCHPDERLLSYGESRIAASRDGSLLPADRLEFDLLGSLLERAARARV